MIKKIFSVVVFILFFASTSFAAFTTTATIDKDNTWLEIDTCNACAAYQRILRVKITFSTDDGADPAEYNLSDDLSSDELEKIAGGLFYAVKIDGDDTNHPDAFTVTFDCGDGADLLSVTTTETGGKAEWFTANDFDKNLPIYDLQIDFGNIGAANDAGIMYIYILR